MSPCGDCERLLGFPFTVRVPHAHGGQWYGRAPCGCTRSLSQHVDGDVTFPVDDVRLCERHDSLGMLGHTWSTLIMPAADALLPWRVAELVEGLVRSPCPHCGALDHDRCYRLLSPKGEW